MAARALRQSPLDPVQPGEPVCLELQDNSISRFSAVEFFRLERSRDSHVPAGRLGEQFVRQNEKLLRWLDVRLGVAYNGRDVMLEAEARNTVGAIPLVSPLHARCDYGVVVKPRFEWSGIGQMLSAMGWRVAPAALRLPLLHRSERRVPGWVVSSMVLVRIQALLDSLDRRFETVTEDRRAPRGRVDWETYARSRLPKAAFLAVPCTYPDLRDDRLLRGAIRLAVERQIRSLETQRHHGAFVHRLIDFAGQLLRRVQNAAPYVPTQVEFGV